MVLRASLAILRLAFDIEHPKLFYRESIQISQIIQIEQYEAGKAPFDSRGVILMDIGYPIRVIS